MSEYSSAYNLSTVRAFQKQAFVLEQEVVNKDLAPVDLTAATNFLLWCKRNQSDADADALFTKVAADFSISGADDNLLQCDVSISDSDLQGVTYFETLVVFTSSRQYKLMFKIDWQTAKGAV